MELKDFIATPLDNKKFQLIIERDKKIDPVWKQFNKGVISRDEYIAIWEQIHRVYKRKLKELDNE